MAGEINARHDIVVNILLNNILVKRGLITHEQKWEDRKMVKSARDEIAVWTEHWRSDEWKNKGRVAGAKLKPDLVWLRRDPGGQWRKVVVDVKITSTGDMKKSFKEKDDKYREWATKETREKKVGMAVMVPPLSPTTGPSTRTQCDDGRALHPTWMLTGCGWPRMCCAIMWS